MNDDTIMSVVPWVFKDWRIKLIWEETREILKMFGSVARGNSILVRESRNGKTPTDNTTAPGDGPAVFCVFFSLFKKKFVN